MSKKVKVPKFYNEDLASGKMLKIIKPTRYYFNETLYIQPGKYIVSNVRMPLAFEDFKTLIDLNSGENSCIPKQELLKMLEDKNAFLIDKHKINVISLDRR